MNRIDRLHAILVHLQGKRRVTAAEIARRFDLSLRTVYRDIRALEESGVPVIGEAGIGYSVMEGYRLPPVMFTREEAGALLLGGKLVHKFTDEQVRDNFQGAMYKIKAVLRSTDKNYVEELEKSVNIQSGYLRPYGDDPRWLSPLYQAIVEKKVVRIDYHTRHNDSMNMRDTEPIGLNYYAHSWHLIAYCRLRKDYRDFRVDRIRKLQLLDDSFNPQQHPSLKEYISRATCSGEMQEVIVCFDRDTSRFLDSQKYYFGFVSEEVVDNRIRMKFLVAFPEMFARWLLSYTNSVKVHSPESMIEAMRKLVRELGELGY